MSAPALLQKWVFNFGSGNVWQLVNGSNPFVATGKPLVCFTNAYIGAAVQLVAYPTDSTGDTFTDFTGGTNSGNYAMSQRIGYKLAPTVGLHTITPPTRDPLNDDSFILIFEDDTLSTSGLTQVTNNTAHDATSGTSWNITTANGTPGLGDRVYATTLIENSVAQPVENLTHPDGWTALFVSQDGSTNLPSELAYIDPLASAALTPAWECTADAHITNHMSMVVGFTKASTSPPVAPPMARVDYSQMPKTPIREGIAA